jgi:hypothetical protein
MIVGTIMGGVIPVKVNFFSKVKFYLKCVMSSRLTSSALQYPTIKLHDLNHKLLKRGEMVANAYSLSYIDLIPAI